MNKKIDRRTFARQSIGMAGIAGFFGATSFAMPATPTLKLKPLPDKFLKGLPKMMELAATPGVTVAYIENGRMTWHGEFGVMNADTKEKVTPETVWQVGSLSKPVFGYAVMKLVHAGKLDLDKPLVNYIPGDLIKDEPRAKLITARHALSHSTGLQNWRFQAGQNLQLAFAPGERWSYSGEGIYYLQRAVEQITGAGFGQFMRDTVIVPLGMTSSSFYWLPEYDKRLATAHNANGAVAVDYLVTNAPRLQKIADEMKKPMETWNSADFERAQSQVETRFPPFPTFYSVNAAGSLIATTADYAKFVTAMFDKQLDEMFRPQVRINDAVSWGLGWGLQTGLGSNQFWHWGEGINYRTFIIADRASRSGIIVFTNARNGRKIWERIVTEAISDQPLLLWL